MGASMSTIEEAGERDAERKEKFVALLMLNGVDRATAEGFCGAFSDVKKKFGEGDFDQFLRVLASLPEADVLRLWTILTGWPRRPSQGLVAIDRY
jgi:hypothetical protein